MQKTTWRSLSVGPAIYFNTIYYIFFLTDAKNQTKNHHTTQLDRLWFCIEWNLTWTTNLTWLTDAQQRIGSMNVSRAWKITGYSKILMRMLHQCFFLTSAPHDERTLHLTSLPVHGNVIISENNHILRLKNVRKSAQLWKSTHRNLWKTPYMY